jgi:hypothetical protein
MNIAIDDTDFPTLSSPAPPLELLLVFLRILYLHPLSANPANNNPALARRRGKNARKLPVPPAPILAMTRMRMTK